MRAQPAPSHQQLRLGLFFSCLLAFHVSKSLLQAAIDVRCERKAFSHRLLTGLLCAVGDQLDTDLLSQVAQLIVLVFAPLSPYRSSHPMTRFVIALLATLLSSLCMLCSSTSEAAAISALFLLATADALALPAGE